MKKLSKRTLALFTSALLLLGVGTVSSTLADPSYQTNEDYTVTLATNALGVEITEGESEYFITQEVEDAVKVGYTYTEDVETHNTKDVDQYQRVVIRKYWTDAQGNKSQALSPELIELTYADGWKVNDAETTAETTVLYYQGIVEGGATVDLIDALRIDTAVLEGATTTQDGAYYVTTYAYDGYKFNIEIEVDAVQTHNADEAIMAAWGVSSSVVGK